MCASLIKAKTLQKHQFCRIFYFRSDNFFDICASLVKAKILQKSHFLKDIFNFLAHCHHFQKCCFLGEIFSFLIKVSFVFEKCQFLVALFSSGSKCQFMQKTLVFGQMSEFLRTVIKSCCANKWGKMTSVSININFLAKMSNLWKIDENLGEMLTFPLSVHYYWKWSCFCKTCLFLEKCDFLCEGLYTLTNCLILVKKKTSIS